MMKTDLVERYVYAVTKNLPKKIREDIDNELHTIIEDMLESRCGDVTPTEHDIKVVLTELGTPSELAEKYSPDADKCLIGQPYYSKYKFLLSIVLIATAFGLSVAGIITTIMEPGAVWYLAVLRWLGMIIMGLAYVFTFVTILFAFFQRQGIAVNIGTDSIENLPPVPKKKAVIPKYESVLGISLSVIFCVVFLVAPQIFCVALVNGKTFIPIFDTQIIKSIWYVIIGFSALGITKESFKLYEGRYTKRLAVVTVITDVLSVLLSFVFLLNSNIINTNFTSAITEVFKNDAEIIASIFAKFNLLFLGVILFALTLDIVISIVKAIKYDK